MAHQITCKAYYDEERGGWRVAWFNLAGEPTDKLPRSYESETAARRAAMTMNRVFSVVAL